MNRNFGMLWRANLWRSFQRMLSAVASDPVGEKRAHRSGQNELTHGESLNLMIPSLRCLRCDLFYVQMLPCEGYFGPARVVFALLDGSDDGNISWDEFQELEKRLCLQSLRSEEA